jgi:hypothetical protein
MMTATKNGDDTAKMVTDTITAAAITIKKVTDTQKR